MKWVGYMVEMQQLRQLIAICDCGTMSAAARELHISQPALSRSMQRLEEALSIRLFDHARGKTHLNAVGRLAVERARGILEEVENMPRILHAYEHSLMTISVGSCAPAPTWLLSEEISRAYPEMTIASELAEPERLLEGLRNDAYQLIVIEEPIQHADVLCRRYVTEELYLSVPPEHPLAEKESIRLDDLAGLTMLIHHDLGRWQRLIDKAAETVDVHFIAQKDDSVLLDAINALSLPCFITNISRIYRSVLGKRVEIPITDEDAGVSFYLCAKADQKALLDRISPLPATTFTL